MVRIPDTGRPTTGSARPVWVVPAAYTWVAGFALFHVFAIVSNGEFSTPASTRAPGNSGLGCVLPNAVVIAICLVAVGVIHRTTGPPRPFVPAWTVFAGAWIGMPHLVLRAAATAVDDVCG